ncbi:gle1-like protein [Cystoisospora suis]|uniref:mRNA export factor GLE1 n=1 Tax=Cystoisospora suis TaxID=483139 RepID=A0A2C6LGH8_9APIC|nr:gle1-like protein [Cystoisospora suis]
MQWDVFPSSSPATFTGTADLRRYRYENLVRKAMTRRKQRKSSFITSHSSFPPSAEVYIHPAHDDEVYVHPTHDHHEVYVHPKSRGASRRVESLDHSSCLPQEPVQSSSSAFFPSSFLVSTSSSPGLFPLSGRFPSPSQFDDSGNDCNYRHVPPENSFSPDHLRKNLRFRIPPLFLHVYPRSPVTYRLDLRFLDPPRLQISSPSSSCASFYDDDHREHLVKVLSPFLSPFLSSHLRRHGRPLISSTETRKDELLYETDSECISFTPPYQAFSPLADDDDDLLFSLSVLSKHVLRRNHHNETDVSESNSFLFNSSRSLFSSASSSSSCHQSSSSSSSSRGMHAGEIPGTRGHLSLSLREEVSRDQEKTSTKNGRTLMRPPPFSKNEDLFSSGLPPPTKLKMDAKTADRREERERGGEETLEERRREKEKDGGKKKKKKKDVYDEFVHALKKAVEEEDKRLRKKFQAEEEEKRRLQEEAERERRRREEEERERLRREREARELAERKAREERERKEREEKKRREKEEEERRRKQEEEEEKKRREKEEEERKRKEEEEKAQRLKELEKKKAEEKEKKSTEIKSSSPSQGGGALQTGNDSSSSSPPKESSPKESQESQKGLGGGGGETTGVSSAWIPRESDLFGSYMTDVEKVLQEAKRVENFQLVQLPGVPNEDVKALRIDIKKRINTALNQLASTTSQVIRVSLLLLSLSPFFSYHVFTCESLREFQRQLKTSRPAEASQYFRVQLCDRLLQLTDKGGQVSSRPSAAWAYAFLVRGLVQEDSLLEPLLRGHFYASCCYAAPFYYRKKQGMSMEEFQALRGQREGENEESFFSRMAAILRLWLGYLVASHQDGQIWAWFARFLNLNLSTPKSIRRICACILVEGLRVAGACCLSVYGRQFHKMMDLIRDKLMPPLLQLQQKNEGSCLSMYVTQLQTCLADYYESHRTLPEPEGKSMKMEATEANPDV